MNGIQPVTFSLKALEEAKKVMIEKDIYGTHALRVAVGGSGCSGGIAPVLGFDRQAGTDMVYEISGVTIVVDKKHILHLMGKHVDYCEVEDVSGFHFTDRPIVPN